MIQRTLANRAYVIAMIRNVAIPLAAGLALGTKLVFAERVVAGLITIAIAALVGVWASHWTGWARAPRITRRPPAPRATRLALVSSIALLLLAGCPPGDSAQPDDEGKAPDGESTTSVPDPSAGPS